MTSELTLRTATDDDFAQLIEMVSGAFLSDPDGGLDHLRMVIEPDRRHVMTDGDRIVGSAGVQTREMTVPGGPIPVAHVTAVAVAPTHRRRGVLSRLMEAQLADIRRREEPVAALWASESMIYGRFGYGRASWNVMYEMPTAEIAVPGETPPGRLHQGVPANMRDAMAVVLERVRPQRPGLSARPGRWWEFRTQDPPERRGGMSSERAVIYQGDDGPEGYAMWRTKSGWAHTGPAGEASVTEILAASREAYAALWRFLLSIDLVRTVHVGFAAVDDPLVHLVSNARALAPRLIPGLWVRVTDVPAALQARRYQAPIDAVLEIYDDRIPQNAGRWHLTGDLDAAFCKPTDAEPDVAMDVRELAAIYMGGTTLASLADAGRVTAYHGAAVARLSAAFSWPWAPLSLEMF